MTKLLQYFYNFSYSLVLHFYVMKTSLLIYHHGVLLHYKCHGSFCRLLLTCNRFLVNTSISRLLLANCLSEFDHFVELKYLVRVNNIHGVIVEYLWTLFYALYFCLSAHVSPASHCYTP